MSHFTVLVIGDDIEKQLAPYDENIHVEPYKVYMNSDELARMADHYELLPKPRKINFEEEEAGPKNIAEMVAAKKDEEETIENDPYRKVFVAAIQKKKPIWPENPSPQLVQGILDKMDDWHGTEGGVDEKGIYCLETYNPKSKWDWYSVGGRWSGFFKLRNGAVGIKGDGRPSPFEEIVLKALKKGSEMANIVGADAEISPDPENERRAPEGYADQAQVKSIDFDTMRLEAAMRNFVKFKTYEPAFKGQDIPLWNVFRQTFKDIDEARKAYFQVPVIKAMHEIADKRKDFLWFEELREEFCNGDLEAFMREKILDAISTFAVVKDGEWIEKGKMGWFGMSSDDAKDREKWRNEFFERFIMPLDPETWLTCVDCHI